jgi:hypothetical protein
MSESSQNKIKLNIPMYVIHLPESNYRLDNIQMHARTYNLPLKVFNATRGNTLQLPALVQNKVILPQAVKHAEMHKGDLGCYLSHCRALEQMKKDAQESGAGIGFIFEDDFKMTDEWKNLHEYIANIPKNIKWDLLYVGYNNIYGDRINKYWTRGKPTTMRGLNSGAWAYIVNVNSIDKILKLCIPITKTCERDLLFRELIGTKLTALFTNKKLVRHEDLFGSDRKDRNIMKPPNLMFKV